MTCPSCGGEARPRVILYHEEGGARYRTHGRCQDPRCNCEWQAEDQEPSRRFEQCLLTEEPDLT